MRPLRSIKADPIRTASEVVEAQSEDVVDEAEAVAKVAEEERLTERQGPVFIGLQKKVRRNSI